MTTSRIGRGAVVTLGAVASLAWAAGAANACDTPPKTPAPNSHDHDKSKPPAPKPTPDTVCTVDESDVQYAPLGSDGKTIAGTWHDATTERFKANSEFGYQVRLNPQVDANCTGTVDVSLASYQTGGATWKTSGGPQTFVDYAHVKLSEASKDSVSQTITVKVPGTTADSKTCFGQVDLYFGTKIYDGGQGTGHGPVPDFKDGVSVPNGDELITAWNGGSGACVATPPVTTPPPVAPPPAPPVQPPVQPTTHPSTPVATKPPAPAPKPSTPATTTSSPSTPTLAHTGANVGEVSLVALAFFGAGGTAMFASRKAKTAGARKH